MKKTRLRSFLVTFGLVLLAAVLPLGLAAGLELVAAPPAPRAEATRLADELNRLLETRLREVFTLASLPSLRAMAASDPGSRSQRVTVALNELQAWVAADTPIREAFIVDRNGVSILSTAKDWNLDWNARAFVRSALSGKPDVSPPSHDVNEYSYYYAAPILDNRKDVAGALVARIAAQELWDPINAASDRAGSYAILLDENGVRLGDGGDPARNLTALSPLSNEQQARVVNEQTYGSQITLIRSDRLYRAANLVRSGALAELLPVDFAAPSIAAQRLELKPWTVIVIGAGATPAQVLIKYVWPLLAAVAAAAVVALLITR